MLNTAPGIFTATQTGSGQGAILQQGSDGQFSYNRADNPAPKGAALEIFATGAGVWTPPALTDLFIDGVFFKTQPVLVTIGGQSARVQYAGTLATQSSWSVQQVNAVVPDGVGSGPQQVVLKIGTNDNSQQKVTGGLGEMNSPGLNRFVGASHGPVPTEVLIIPAAAAP